MRKHPSTPTRVRWCGSVFAVVGAAALVAIVACAAPVSAASDSTAARGAPAMKLPADAVYTRGFGADSAVVFSHRSHVTYEGNSCTGCHPKLFKILKPLGHTSHGEMNGGGTCGACHDGQKAFGVKDAAACRSCHTGQKPAVAGAEAAPTESRIPKPFFYPRGGDSPGVVTFRHETHAKDKCASCHPKLFPMKVTPARPDGGMHDPTSCGACHDGRKSFDVENPDLCEKCHVEPRGGAR